MTSDEIEANAVLSFRDEQGAEWLAAAIVGPLTRKAVTSDEHLDLDTLKDRAFVVTGFTVVKR